MRAWVDQRRLIGRTLAIYYGQLEAMLARHWPEAWTHIDVCRQRSSVALMKTFPGPKAIAADPDGAKELLRKASRGHFDKKRLEALVASAATTTGVPMTCGEQEKLRALVEQLEGQQQRLRAVDDKLSEFVEKDEVLRQMTTVVGPACSAAIGALGRTANGFWKRGSVRKGDGTELEREEQWERDWEAEHHETRPRHCAPPSLLGGAPDAEGRVDDPARVVSRAGESPGKAIAEGGRRLDAETGTGTLARRTRSDLRSEKTVRYTSSRAEC